MSEPAAETKEGWGAPVRAPFLAAAAILLLLTVGLIGGGRLYLARVAASTRPPPAHFPLPHLEIIRTSPGERRRTVRPAPPADIARAMAETARKGDALWDPAKP